MPEAEKEVVSRLPDLTIKNDTHTFSVQSNPPLIIETVKATGEEIQHGGENAFAIWNSVIKDLLAEPKAIIEEKVALNASTEDQKPHDDAKEEPKAVE